MRWYRALLLLQMVQASRALSISAPCTEANFDTEVCARYLLGHSHNLARLDDVQLTSLLHLDRWILYSGDWKMLLIYSNASFLHLRWMALFVCRGSPL